MQLFPLLRVAAALAAGIAAAGLWPAVAPSWVWLSLTAALAVAAAALMRRPVACSVLLLLSFAAFGAWRMAHHSETEAVDLPPGAAAYEAVLLDRPARHGKVARCDIVVTGPGKPFRAVAAILCDTVENRWEHLDAGSGIAFYSQMEKPGVRPRSNPGYAKWMETRGVKAETFVYWDCWRFCSADISPLSRWERVKLRAMVFRRGLVDRLDSLGMGGDEKAVVAAMALGDKSGLSKELKEDYSASGASHVLALSGLHIGIIYSMLLLLFPRRRWRFATQAMALSAIWAYAVVVGLQPSVVRSASMVTAYGVFSLPGRGRMSLNALSMAAVVMLLANPVNLWDAGFQMSFMAVLGILAVYAPFSRAVGVRGPAPLRWVFDMAAVSVAAQLATFPLVLYYFGRFPCYFILSNFIAIPAATVILYGACFMALASPWPAVQAVLAKMLAAVAGWLNGGLGWIAGLPGASVGGLEVGAAQAAALYVLVACVCLAVRRVWLAFRWGGYYPLK